MLAAQVVRGRSLTRPARRLLDRRRPLLRPRDRRPLLPLPPRRARPLPRRPPVRGVRAARRCSRGGSTPALAPFLAAGIALTRLGAARRRRVRVGVREPDPGAEHVRRRAVLPDRAARLGRARAAAAALGGAAPSPSRAALLPLAIPFERFIETGAISDTLALLPIWAAFGSLLFDSIDATVLAGGVAGGGALPASCRVASRSRLPRATLLFFAAISHNVWFGEHGFKRASVGRALHGHPGRRPRLDRRRRAGRRDRGGRLDRRHRPVRRQPERVLQPQRRADLLRRRADPGRARGDGGDGRRGDRGAPHDGRAARRRARTCSPRTRSRPTASSLARDPGIGLTLWRAREPARRDGDARSTASTRTTRGPGRTVTWTRERCRGGTLTVSLSSDPSLFDEDQIVTASRGRRGRGPGADRAAREPRDCACRRRPSAATCRVVFRVAQTKVPGRRRRPRARRPLQHLRLPSVRIAFDVSPLSHPRTGIGNYVRGSLAGLAEAAAGEHELVAFAPTRLRGRRLIREALADVPVEVRTLVLPWSHALPDGLEPPRPALRRALPRPGRRPPLQRLDRAAAAAAGSARRWCTTSSRSCIPEWVTPRTRSMHGYKYARTAECDLVFVNSAYTGRDVEEHLGVPARADPRRAAGRLGRVHGRGRARRARPPVRAQPRHARAAQEPRARWSRRGGRCAASSRSRSRARAGWGDQPLLDDAGILKLGFVAEGEVPRLMRGAAVVRLPVALRGLRDADRGGDGVRRPGRRVLAPVDGRGVRRRRGPCRSRTTPRR